LGIVGLAKLGLPDQDPNVERQLKEAKVKARKWYLEHGVMTPEEKDGLAIELGFWRFVHQKQRSATNQRNYRLDHPEQKEREKVRQKTEKYKIAHRAAVKRYKQRLASTGSKSRFS